MPLDSSHKPAISPVEAVRIISEAVIKANDRYREISGGMTLHGSGVEAYVSGHIAHALFNEGQARNRKVHTTLETPFHLIREWSGAKTTRGTRPSAIRHKGRVDVAYFDDGEEREMGIIEVKRYFNWSTMERDVERIRALLRRCGPERSGVLKWGCVVGFHIDYEGTRKLGEERLQSFEASLLGHFLAKGAAEPRISSFCGFKEVAPSERSEQEKWTRFHAPAVLFELT